MLLSKTMRRHPRDNKDICSTFHNFRQIYVTLVDVKTSWQTISQGLSLSVIDYDEVAECQESDEELKQLLKTPKALILKRYPLPSGRSLWCDSAAKNIRPFVPKMFRFRFFQNIHELAHPGVRATVKQMTEKYVWPSINDDVRKWTQACIGCQRSKVNKHTKSPIGTFVEADDRFSVVHIDIVGPLPPSDGYTYLLTMIDRFSSWMEAVPIVDIKAETVAKTFFSQWISRYGAHTHLVSDRGRQFQSCLFRKHAELCGINLRHTTPYHPQSHGKVERLHRTLKTAVKAHNSPKWTETLPIVLLGLRAAIREDIDASLAHMVFACQEIFSTHQGPKWTQQLSYTLQKSLEMLKPVETPHKTARRVFVHKDLAVCSHSR
uniref:RNA-directed DNA polymerase n=1 Tax=Lygus hesperus TaxID=30085 RepID=A0A0A9W1Z8_LYGHE